METECLPQMDRYPSGESLDDWPSGAFVITQAHSSPSLNSVIVSGNRKTHGSEALSFRAVSRS